MSHLSATKKKYERVDRHIRANMEKMPPDELERAMAKQEKRANTIALLMRLELRQWEELAAGNYTRIIKHEIKHRTLQERFARARAEGRPMVESWTIEREAKPKNE